MDINLSIAAAFEAAFGYKSSAFEPVFDAVHGNRSAADDFDRVEFGRLGSPMYANDAVTGREYYLPVTLSYVNDAGTMVTFDLPHPIVTIEARKTLVRTQLTERKSDVTELINMGGYTVTIRGLMISLTNEMPEGLMVDVANAYMCRNSVTVRNGVTDLLLQDVLYNCVIERMSWPEVKGVKHVRPYELVLASELEFSLEEV